MQSKRGAAERHAAAADAGATKPPPSNHAAGGIDASQAVPGPTAQAVAVVGLFALAILYTLYVARVLLLPIILALLISFILRPIVRLLVRLHIPEALGALIVVGALTGGAGWAVYGLSGPASAWLQTAPQVFRHIEQRVRVLKETMQDVRQATDQVQKLAAVGDPPPVVAVQQADFATMLVTGTWNAAASVGMVLILTFALLASGELFWRKFINVLPTFRDKQRMIAMSRAIEDSISTYLLTVSLINAALGTAVAIAMALLGMPNPLLWGAVAAVLNYIPYLGAATGITIVAMVSLMSYPNFGQALLPPAVYLALATVEGQLITPFIHSLRFTLNPVAVLLALFFWGWIWGIPGALLAVPLLVTLRIVCDFTSSLRVFSEFLGG